MKHALPVDALKLVDYGFFVRIALDDDDRELGKPCEVSQQQPLPLAHTLTLALPLTDQEVAFAFKHHVNVAGNRFGVALNQPWN